MNEIDDNMKELEYELKERLSSEKIVVLRAAECIIVAVYYANNEMIDSVLVLGDKDGNWEIIEGEKSEYASCLYVAYSGALIDLLSDKFESDELLQSDLLH